MDNHHTTGPSEPGDDFSLSELDYQTLDDSHLPPRRRFPRWLTVAGVTSALVLLGAGAVLGANALTASAANAGGASPISYLNGTPAPGQPRHRNGPGVKHGRGDLAVSSVSGQTITTKDARGNTVTVKVSSSTQYTRLGKSVSLSSITPGTTIHVRGTRNSDGSINASQVVIAVPSYAGQITAINGSNITIKDRQGASHTITTTSSTSVKRAGETSNLSALAVGDNIIASGAKHSDGSLAAEQIRVLLPNAGGQIQSVTSTALTVKDRRGNTVTIHLSSSTRYYTVTMGSNGPTHSASSASALKNGEYVSAEGTKNSDGSLNAEVVVLLPNAPAGGPHGGSGSPHPDHNGDAPASGTNTSNN